ncbi:MAG: tRNA lysidine(34) synthetase TilS, partial [Pseudomonadota bacterium]
RFDRVRMRAALPALAELGLDVERLTATTGAMARARDALEEMTRECAARALTVDATGAATLASVAAAEELRLRLLAAVLQLVSGARYRPRLADLERLAAAWAAGDLGGGRTLHGCLIRPEGPALRILREPAAVAPPGRADALWDRRWRIAGAPPGATLGALGAEAGDAALATTPALRAPDGTLLAAPVAQPDGRVTATFDPPDPLGLLPKPR